MGVCPVTVSRWPRVVVIDAARAARALWRQLDACASFQVTALDCRDATRDALLGARPDVIVLDWSVGCDPSGWPLLHALSIDAALQRVPVVICAAGTAQTRSLPDRDESVHILPRPFGLDELLDVLVRVLGDAPSAPPVRSHLD